MKELRKLIQRTIKEHLNEQVVDSNNIKDIILKRVPFLKEYNIYTNPSEPNRLVAQRINENENVKIMMGDELLNFPYFNVSSDISYYSHKVYDNTFHNFSIRNRFHVRKPEEMDYITYRVFLMGIKQIGEELSYTKELRIRDNENISQKEFDKIINEMNGTLFKLEEYTDKHSINLF
jgi:hypothetical protein